MKCAYCGFLESKVIDSRQTEDGLKIRRRRECLKCGARFTTYELIEHIPLMVIKRDKSQEEFNRDKLVASLIRACVKRHISLDKIEMIVSDIESYCDQLTVREVKSTEIGDMVMERLKDVDQVAYVRFASVYKDFNDIDSFIREINKLKKDN